MLQDFLKFHQSFGMTPPDNWKWSEIRTSSKNLNRVNRAYPTFSQQSWRASIICSKINNQVSVQNIQCGMVIMRSIFTQISQKKPHSSADRARYGVVSFVDPAFDWYSASVPVIIYVISYHIGLRYDGTRLYKYGASTILQPTKARTM